MYYFVYKKGQQKKCQSCKDHFRQNKLMKRDQLNKLNHQNQSNLLQIWLDVSGYLIQFWDKQQNEGIFQIKIQKN